MHFRLPILILAMALLMAHFPGQALAQAHTPDVEVEYIFGERITFQAIFEPESLPESVLVFFEAEGQHHTEVKPVSLTPAGTASYVHDLSASPLRAFSVIRYWLEVTLPDGTTYNTPADSFYYEDNRFAWQSLDEGPFRIHYYSGDVVFAQSVLDVAQAGLQKIQNLLPIRSPEKVDIYAYASSSDMQAAINLTGYNWVAGHAEPDLNVMVVALPQGPDQRMLMEQRIPHELMHVMLYSLTGKGYTNIPPWLNEGLATNAELFPNPDYQVLLNDAYQKGTLLSMASLCQPFPRDASNALLAYAQSASFTRFLYQRFGTAGMQALVTHYYNGIACEQGIESALDSPLVRLERQWRQAAFAEDATLTALGNLLPWLILTLAALGVPLLTMLSRLRSKTVSPEPKPKRLPQHE